MKKQWTIFDLRDVTVVAGKYFNYEEDYFENTYDYREQVSLLTYRYLSVLPYLCMHIPQKFRPQKSLNQKVSLNKNITYASGVKNYYLTHVKGIL